MIFGNNKSGADKLLRFFLTKCKSSGDEPTLLDVDYYLASSSAFSVSADDSSEASVSSSL